MEDEDIFVLTHLRNFKRVILTNFEAHPPLEAPEWSRVE